MAIYINGAIICSDTVNMMIQVQNPCNLLANFYSYRDSLVAIPNPPYHFINTTTPQNATDSIRWTFGDGTSSNQLNPIHTYAQPGTYNVCLRVQQRTSAGTLSNCVSEICHPVVVPVPVTCNLLANFNIVPQTSVPNSFYFQNTSTPFNITDSVRWTFGDGSQSNLNNPTHTYAHPGTYSVCLRVQQRTPNGTLTNCVSEICRIVVVQNTTVCTLVANFYSYRDSLVTVPYSYHFVNTSAPSNPTDSIRWTFGDGTSSNQLNPVHNYTQPGTYTVCLRVQQRTNAGTLTNCVSEICHIVVVQNIITCNLVANFTISPVTAIPNSFQFVNTSTPLNATDSIRWTFGDGTFSNQVSPYHTYTLPGTYNVCLRIQQRNPNGGLTNCVREICHTVIVQTPSACTLTANFTTSLVAGTINTYHFTNTSVPLNNTDSIRWTFGDGTTSNQVSPNHTYLQPGTYNVCLRIQQRDPSGGLTNCVREICHTIIVQTTTACNLVVNFTSTLIQTAPNTFHFGNTSTPLNNTDSIRWSFGDGTTSNQVSPNHTFLQPGTYTVCLRIQQRTSTGGLSNCIREICQPVVVTGTNTCNLVVNFTSVIATATANTFYFQNTSTPLNLTDSIRWNFGDGTSSNQLNPVHTYLQPGNYTVCLRVQQRNPNGTLSTCVREVCRTVIVQHPNICNLFVNFYSYRDTLSTTPVAFLYHFVNTSNPINSTDSIRWTFGDGSSSSVVNPVHAYAQPGTYLVCLRIQKRNSNGTLSNCIRQMCHYVYVGQVISPSNCTLQLFPNPVTTVVNVNLYLPQPQMIDVYIYSFSNVLVGEKHQQGFTGNNTVSVSTANLLPGIYRMRVVRGNNICHAYFIKI
jgi:PKD repeat protein